MGDTELPWLVFGRKMRPYSLALSLATGVVSYSILTGKTLGRLLATFPGQAVGVVGIVTVLLLVAGYWMRSDWAMTQGLLMSVGVWVAVTVVIGIDTGAFGVSTMMAACWAVASGGAWLLEVSHMATRKPRHAGPPE